MSSSHVQQPRFNPVATLVWLTALVLLVLVLALGEMRQARHAFGADIAQLNGDAKGLLLRPALLEPDYAKRVAQLGRVVAQLEERVQLESRLLGLSAQHARLSGLREEVAALEGALKELGALERLLEEMVDLPSTDLQLDRLLQNLQTPVGSANDLVRLRAFLAARKPVTGPGAEPDPFLLGVDNARDQLRAALATIDGVESRRSEVLAMLDEAHKAAIEDVRAWPVNAQFALVLAAIIGVTVLGLWACRRTVIVEVPAQTERAWRIEPLPVDPAWEVTEQVFPLVQQPEELDWQQLPRLDTEPQFDPPAVNLPAVNFPVTLAPAAPSGSSPVLNDEALLELQRSVDGAIETSQGFERRIRSLVDGADIKPNELLQQAQDAFEELNALLQRAREGALNMAFGLDDSPASEDRFASADRLEQLLVAGMACLKRWQAWSVQNLGGSSAQPLVTRRALIALQFELQHQLARQQTELRNLSKRLQSAHTALLVQ